MLKNIKINDESTSRNYIIFFKLNYLCNDLFTASILSILSIYKLNLQFM